MANVDHKNLTTINLHEPKDCYSASADEVYVADGVGSGTWKKPTEDSIDASAGSSNQVLISDGTDASWGFPDTHVDGWQDLRGSFISAKLTGSNQPTWTKVKDNGSGSTGVYAYSFSASALNEVWLALHINHDYKEGTAFYPHIHWIPSDTNTGVVRWGIEWSASQGHGQAAFGNTTLTYIEQAGSGTAFQHQIAEVSSPGITISNAEPDMIILARVFRDAAHANDTYTGACFGIELDAHYELDRHATPNKSPPFS